MLIDLKAYATGALRARNIARARYWAKHGSTRYLWSQASLNAAMEYVLNGQGVKMACYPTSQEAEDRVANGSLTLLGSDSA
jgi:hypothetical protein